MSKEYRLIPKDRIERKALKLKRRGKKLLRRIEED